MAGYSAGACFRGKTAAQRFSDDSRLICCRSIPQASSALSESPIGRPIACFSRFAERAVVQRSAHSSMRTRIVVSTAIGLTSGVFCWFLMKHFHQGAVDFGWAIHLAQRLLARQNPYDTPLEQYPLTAALIAFPFVRLPAEVAAGIFSGLSSGLLAFGLTRDGYTRL